MANIEQTATKLVSKAGSTALTLDKDAGKVTSQQKMSGASIYHSVLHRRTGEITLLTTEEAKDAAETVKKLREFVGL